MMTGIVDDADRALLPIRVSNPSTGATATIEGWIDTAFTGALLLTSEQQVAGLALPLITAQPGAMADGSRVFYDMCRCQVEWFGIRCPVDTVVSASHVPVIGLRLLKKCLLTINYRARRVSVAQ